MKQKTLEETYLNELIDEANKEFTLDKKLAKEVAIKFYKWQEQRMYTEQEVLVLLHKRDKHNWDRSLWQTPKEWLEKFKNK